jgi:asparagine synthase (glutamine-hydrolysing)
MCGLTAIIAPEPVPLSEMVLSATRLVSHRGPDDEGYAIFSAGLDVAVVAGSDATPEACYRHDAPYAPQTALDPAIAPAARVALGHRRLSILDISAAGHQPMCSADGRYWIVYNGEIYNYLELREELATTGYVFHTQSDTEVLLAAYDRWGMNCLHQFNGMFSFVIVDRRTQRLFAARDRFGIKPLYYWVSPHGIIALTSEIKQFTAVPGWRAELNSQRAYDFLNWNAYDHTDETLFAGVFQLRGGEALELNLATVDARRPAYGSRLPVRSWYSLLPRPFGGSPQKAMVEWLELLEDAVRLQLRSDVPVGSCLSGGLDSSLLVALVRRRLDHLEVAGTQKTFSAFASGSRRDERPFIEAVVQATRVESHGTDPDPRELFDQLDTVTWQQDEPFGSPSIFAQWCVFRLAALNDIKVTLDGQGADELLAGYHNYFGVRLAGLLKDLRLCAWYQETRALRLKHGYSWLWAAQQSANFLLPEMLRQPLRRVIGKSSTAASWLDLNRLGAAPNDPFLAAKAVRAGSVRAMSLAQIAHTSLPMLLHCADRDSMAHSVEARVPYLDHRLVEFSVGLPDEYKIGDGTTKRVQRQAAAGLLPDVVRMRADKVGFATAEETWLQSPAHAAFRDALQDAVDGSRGIIRRQALDWLEQVVKGQRPYSHELWRMISFGAWLRVFQVMR